jgi:hypothetical protein
MGLPKCENGMAIGIGHDLAAVLLRRTRAVGGVLSVNPALNGAPMDTKTASQLSLGGTILVQLSHQRSLCGS